MLISSFKIILGTRSGRGDGRRHIRYTNGKYGSSTLLNIYRRKSSSSTNITKQQWSIQQWEPTMKVLLPAVSQQCGCRLGWGCSVARRAAGGSTTTSERERRMCERDSRLVPGTERYGVADLVGGWGGEGDASPLFCTSSLFSLSLVYPVLSSMRGTQAARRLRIW